MLRGGFRFRSLRIAMSLALAVLDSGCGGGQLRLRKIGMVDQREMRRRS
jgi:hypothetical protein